jgi:hypothetical protein
MRAGWLCVVAVAGCGDDGGAPSSDAATSGGDAAPGARPHPNYPSLDLDTLPGTGGGALGPYTPPTLPATTRSVTVTSTGSTARDDLQTACQAPGTAVSVPAAAGRIGVVNLGDVSDCDVSLASAVIIDTLVIGSLPGPMEAPAHRIRIRGGQVGSMLVIGGSSDLVFDGVAFDNGVVPSGSRTGTAMYMPTGSDPADVVERVVVVNSIIRMVGVAAGNGDIDGTAYLGARTRDLMFANNNIVTAGNRNSWGFRLSGADNTLLVDNTVRVSFHKLVRMNDAPVDYVYIKGGTWMRESTLTSSGMLLNDSFAQIGSTTDQVYIHEPAVYLLPDAPVSFGMTFDPMQSGKRWEARRIRWFARSAGVIDDARLMSLAGGCVSGATCDYGIGTHAYSYDASLALPAAPWRDLPAFTNDDPTARPVEP